MDDLPVSRSDQISIASQNPETWHRITMAEQSQEGRKGYCNVPHPPSPQMVIEILSIAVNGEQNVQETGGAA
jgi:hypothetical protein